eukprot:2445049-Prorocentrum_lima.AAC.1
MAMHAQEGNSGRSSPRSTAIDHRLVPTYEGILADEEHRCGSCNHVATENYLAAFDPDTDT